MAFQTNASDTFQEDHWPLVHLTHLINHCIRLSHFPTLWKEAKVVALPKPGKGPKFPQNFRPISLLPSTGKVFEKVILEIVKRHIRERNLLNASQFGFRARHSTTLQCTRLADHVTLNFNNSLSIAAVFLDIEKAFDTTWHPDLLYKLLNYNFQPIKLISSFLSVESEMSTPRYMQARVPQGSVLSPTLYNMYIKDPPPPQTPGCKLSSLCGRLLYVCDRPQRGLCSEKNPACAKLLATWCESWNIKINEDNTRAIYFTHRNRPPGSLLKLNGRNIPFLDSVKYLRYNIW
jgi:hypothetical protein